MNDFSELERDLKKLRPAPVSPNLAARIEQALAASAAATPTAGVTKQRRLLWNWLPLGFGLAAAAAFLLLARLNVDRAPKPSQSVAATSPAATFQTAPVETLTQQQPTAATLPNYIPTGVTQVVYNRRDEGLQFQRGVDRPMRRVRSRQRETMQWRDPQTGASLRVSYPTEEVTLTPISGQ
jgi:hypothetical protein